MPLHAIPQNDLEQALYCGYANSRCTGYGVERNEVGGSTAGLRLVLSF